MAKLSPERLVFTSAYGARDPIQTGAGTTPAIHNGADFGPEKRNTPGIVLQSIIPGSLSWLSDQYGALGVRTTTKATGDLLTLLRRLYGGVIEGAAVSVSLWHLERRIALRDSNVVEGQAVGVMGSTGRSTGIHVHVELRIGGKTVDPKPFIDAQASKAVAPAPGDYYEEDDVALTPNQERALEWLFDNAAGLDQLIQRRKMLDDTYERAGIAARDATAALEPQRVMAAQVEQLFIRRGALDQQGVRIEAILEVVKQQAAAQGVTIDVDAIVTEMGERLRRDAD